MLTKQSEQPSIYATFYSAIPFDVKTYTILNSCTAPCGVTEKACWCRLCTMSVSADIVLLILKKLEKYEKKISQPLQLAKFVVQGWLTKKFANPVMPLGATCRQVCQQKRTFQQNCFSTCWLHSLMPHALPQDRQLLVAQCLGLRNNSWIEGVPTIKIQYPKFSSSLP